jgi:hypothetical protein
MTTVVRLRGEVVATAGAGRFHLGPQIEALPESDPLVRKVILMCVFALDVSSGEVEGPYTDARAEAFAKAAQQELD